MEDPRVKEVKRKMVFLAVYGRSPLAVMQSLSWPRLGCSLWCAQHMLSSVGGVGEMKSNSGNDDSSSYGGVDSDFW